MVLLCFMKSVISSLLLLSSLFIHSSFILVVVQVHSVPPEILASFPFLPQTFTGYDIAKLNFYLALTLTATSQILVGSWKAYEKGGLMNLGRAYLNLCPFVVFYFSSLLWCLQSPIALKKHHLLTVKLSFLILFSPLLTSFASQLLMLGAVFVELATHTMLMHICDSTIKPAKRYVIKNTPHL